MKKVKPTQIPEKKEKEVVLPQLVKFYCPECSIDFMSRKLILNYISNEGNVLVTCDRCGAESIINLGVGIKLKQDVKAEKKIDRSYLG